MNEEYLWDKSGEADPEAAALEDLLAPLRYRGWRRRQIRWVHWLAAAAALVLVCGLAWLKNPGRPLEPAWRMASSNGSSALIYPGQDIQTDANSRVTLQSEFVGQVTLEPQSHLRVESATPDQQLLSLRRGEIHALIWAPPKRFVVDTPSARTTDLGCAYTLHVDQNGAGLLTVETGWVAFDWKGIESFIPAGAACSTRPMRGPGVPYYLDSSSAFRAALASLGENAVHGPLQAVLDEARDHDALSLWHLLKRLPPDDRGRAFDRFSQLVKLPPTVTREGVIAGNPAMLDQAWDALDLGDTDWWRLWRQHW